MTDEVNRTKQAVKSQENNEENGVNENSKQLDDERRLGESEMTATQNNDHIASTIFGEDVNDHTDLNITDTAQHNSDDIVMKNNVKSDKDNIEEIVIQKGDMISEDDQIRH